LLVTTTGVRTHLRDTSVVGTAQVLRLQPAGRFVMTDEDYLTHGQPDPWREGYNQALREVRDTLMDGNHE